MVESFLCCASWDTFQCPHIISLRSFTAISFRKTVVDQVYLASFWRYMLECSWTGWNIATCANCCISKAKLSLLTADGIVLQMVVFFRLLRVLRYFSNAVLSSFSNVAWWLAWFPNPLLTKIRLKVSFWLKTIPSSVTTLKILRWYRINRQESVKRSELIF